MAVRIGDIVATTTPDGTAYVQYVGALPEYGDVVRVEPQLHGGPAPELAALFGEAYFTFYPARIAVRRGLACVVGHLEAPPIPARWRRAGVRRGEGIESWVIEEESVERVTRRLTEAELQLPIAAVWNHELLLTRIAERWRPRNVRG
jgi:hypothetical protein